MRTTLKTKTIEALMSVPYFSIKRDMQIVNSNGFWCEACLVGMPASELSPDPRYCQGCYDYLQKEAEMLDGNRYPAWMPKAQKPQESLLKPCRVSGDVSPILSTLNDKKIKVDKIPPRPVPKNKRGRKHKDLPKELVLGFAREEMGSKAITTELKKRGIVISYKTIQRLLKGEVGKVK